MQTRGRASLLFGGGYGCGSGLWERKLGEEAVVFLKIDLHLDLLSVVVVLSLAVELLMLREIPNSYIKR